METGDYMLKDDDSVLIDTKYGLQEVYGDLVGKEHARFKAECLRRGERRLIFLVEEAGIGDLSNVKAWDNPRIRNFRPNKRAQLPPLSSERLQKMMETMKERYGVEWMFCDKRSTGRIIVQLLTEGKDADI